MPDRRLDELRLNVTRTTMRGDEEAVAVEIRVNGEEMTTRGAGLGMDPYDVLVPVNRFEATTDARRVAVARCGCGIYGCGVTDVDIVRDGRVVHWDWRGEVPVDRRHTFDAAQYDAEVRRAGADHSWETADRTVGRLVLEGLDAATLADHGLSVSWIGATTVCLAYRDTHQVLLDITCGDRAPEVVAAELLDTLHRRAPSEWQASWHPLALGGGPPPIAGPGWSRLRYG